MDLLALWQQDFQSPFTRLLEDLDLGLTEDRKDFVFVDGEEGDFGDIRYMDKYGRVVCVRTIEGGDRESLELTDYGKPIIAAKMLEVFKDALSKKLGLAPGSL
ncbi:hypothetical protein AB4Y45_32975 [Paraburkholderia sp. EG287A]|uniref:hypothetical protein n=1 Tax=Paraburkholderia sp. EG287A TaxID=3237012 RepID=UPI0034D21F03